MPRCHRASYGTRRILCRVDDKIKAGEHLRGKLIEVVEYPGGRFYAKNNRHLYYIRKFPPMIVTADGSRVPAIIDVKVVYMPSHQRNYAQPA